MTEGLRRRHAAPGRILAVVLALAVPIAAWWLASEASDETEAWLTTPQGGGSSYPLVFEIPRGASARAIARRLQGAGFLPDRQGLAWLGWLRLTGRAGRLRAGEYELTGPASPEELTRLLLEGRVRLHPITLPEGLTLEQTVEALAATGFWAPEELERAFRDPSSLGLLDPEAPDLEGYLFPETHHLPKGLSAEELARLLVRAFEEAWTALEGKERSSVLGLSVRELVTLASLVERETAVPQEHRLVSSVFHNRLRRGMRLECDATVIRALELDGLWRGGPLLRSQLSHDSPYNTYVAPALPPGPIASPGKAALAAALDPAQSRLLYFVADGTGGHAFAETFAQHERNVRRWRQVQREGR